MTFYGKRKGRLFPGGFKRQQFCDALADLGKHITLPKSTYLELEKLVYLQYGKKSSRDVNHA